MAQLFETENKAQLFETKKREETTTPTPNPLAAMIFFFIVNHMKIRANYLNYISLNYIR